MVDIRHIYKVFTSLGHGVCCTNPVNTSLFFVFLNVPIILVQELGKQNPELLTLINANQQEFLRIINEPVPPEQAQEVSQQIAQFQAAGMAGTAQGEGRESPYQSHSDIPRWPLCLPIQKHPCCYVSDEVPGVTERRLAAQVTW